MTILMHPVRNGSLPKQQEGKPRVLVTFHLPEQGQRVLDQHRDELEIIQWPKTSICNHQWLYENVEGCNGLLVSLVDKIDAAVIERAGDGLAVVSSLSAGYDHVDFAAMRKHRVRFATTPEALSEAVADTSLMLALMATRRGGEAMRLVLHGGWPAMPWGPQVMCGHSMTGSTIGFLGFGRIAQATLARLLPFRPTKILYTGSKLGAVARHDYYDLFSRVDIAPVTSYDELARESDVLFVCCSLTPATRKLVDAAFLSKMKSRAVIVNTARGAVIDNDALAAALSEGRIFGAGLDVLDGEPDIPADHPLVREHRCVILPHMGSATLQTRGLMSEQAVLNLLAGLRGEKMISEKSLDD